MPPKVGRRSSAALQDRRVSPPPRPPMLVSPPSRYRQGSGRSSPSPHARSMCMLCRPHSISRRSLLGIIGRRWSCQLMLRLRLRRSQPVVVRHHPLSSTGLPRRASALVGGLRAVVPRSIALACPRRSSALANPLIELLTRVRQTSRLGVAGRGGGGGRRVGGGSGGGRGRARARSLEVPSAKIRAKNQRILSRLSPRARTEVGRCLRALSSRPVAPPGLVPVT